MWNSRTWVTCEHHFIKTSFTPAMIFPGAKKLGKLSGLLLLNVATKSNYIYFFKKTF